MKKLLLLIAASILLNAVYAQDTVHVNVCTRLWKGDLPVTATIIYPGAGANPSFAQLDSTHSCADFEFILSQLSPDATFSFSASKEQDTPLNGLTVLDLYRMATHVIGIEPLTAHPILAADVNRSTSLTTFDIVEARKMLVGIYTQWPQAGVWRFIPDYQLPFANPSNPFMGGAGPDVLSVAQLQALNGGTIVLIGEKTGDVDGDVNPTSAFQGPGIDAISLNLPDIMLSAGQPVTLPVRIDATSSISGLQIEFIGLSGAIEFNNITPALFESTALSSHVSGTSQDSRIRAVYSGLFNLKNATPDSTLFFLHLTPNVDIPLKDAIKIAPQEFPAFVADGAFHATQLQLNFSNAVAVTDPSLAPLQILAASPNPFDALSQVQIELLKPESVLLEVFDLTGKILLRTTSNLSAGTHFLDIPGAIAPKGSAVTYRVSIAAESKSGKLFRL